MIKEIKLTDISNYSEDKSYNEDEFSKLKESIKLFGLLHPPILQGDMPPYTIIAGRKRLLALHDLGITVLQANVFESSIQFPHEISLHENLRRHNLPWYEQVEYEKELHELRQSQHGKTPHGRPENDSKKGWSQRDTAKELGIALGPFNEDLQLANALAANPNLRNVKDRTTALKLVKQSAAREMAIMEAAIPDEGKFNEVYLGDSRDILKLLPAETFDTCITDPPWSQYKDETLKSDQESLLPVFHELFRVMKKNSFLLLITSTVDSHFYYEKLPKLGFKLQDYPIIWRKPKTITHGRAPWQFARDYEPIIVAVKGAPLLTTGIECSSILEFDNLHYTKMIHPHEKPIGLIKNLLNLTSYAGSKIIDPFAGSGVVLNAAKDLSMPYIGIEKNKDFYDNIVRRLK